MNKTTTDQISVKIVYPSAHGPAEGTFAPSTPISDIKAFALNAFGEKEGTVDGNQVVFFLFHNRTKLEKLDQPISSLANPNEKVNLRLAKEIIAG